MGLSGAWDRLRSSLQDRGPLLTLRLGFLVLLRQVLPRRERPHPFDVRAGVDTGGLLGPEDIASGHAHDRETTAYFGSQPSVFLALMNRWTAELRETGQRLEDFTFVDVGCGKGRVLMLASEFPFRRVVGIELSPVLVHAASENLIHWNRVPRRCADLTVLHADVLDYPLPETPTLLFLYHPFEEGLFEQWVRSLLLATGTRNSALYLAYLNPVHEASLRILPEARLLWTGEVPFSVREALVHHFKGTAERVSLYRLAMA